MHGVGVLRQGAMPEPERACRYYVAELVKLYPLLAAAWGVGLFRELRGVGRRAALLLASTCGAYVLGVLLLAFARNHSSV